MLYIAIPIAILSVAYGIAYFITERPAPPTDFIPPDKKFNYIHPEGWKGTPVDQKKRFVNYEFPFYQDYIRLLRWLPSHVLNLVRNCGRRYEPVIHSGSEFLCKKNVLIWLGHASFYLDIDGIKILIDPHFFNTSIYRRHTPAPIAPELFSGIDYILLSHDHADHCDKKSIRILIKNNPHVTLLTGLNMDTLLRSFTSLPLNIHTADWYRQYPIASPLKIYFVPSRHYCRRLGGKFNGYLWGGFIIKYPSGATGERTIYFEGDSGEGDHFADIKHLFSPDLAMIGVGAYQPRWFMHPNHMSPEDAIAAFDVSGAAVMIPMHYGTFNLSNENMDAPLTLMKRYAQERNIIIPVPGYLLQLV